MNISNKTIMTAYNKVFLNVSMKSTIISLLKINVYPISYLSLQTYLHLLFIHAVSKKRDIIFHVKQIFVNNIIEMHSGVRIYEESRSRTRANTDLDFTEAFDELAILLVKSRVFGPT